MSPLTITQYYSPDAPPCQELNTSPHKYSPTVAWLLQLYFEALILHPVHHSSPSPNPKRQPSPNTIVHQRLSQFRQGHLQALWIAAQTKLPPNTTLATADSLSIQAQLLANEDNYHGAYAKLTKALPIAPLNSQNQAICSKLFPPLTTYQPTLHNTRPHSTPVIIHKQTLFQTLRHKRAPRPPQRMGTTVQDPGGLQTCGSASRPDVAHS